MQSRPPKVVGAGAENRTPLAGQAIRRPTNRPHPRKLERHVRIELTSGVWKTPALPLDECRLVAAVGVEPTDSLRYERDLEPSTPQLQLQRFVCQRPLRA